MTKRPEDKLSWIRTKTVIAAAFTSLALPVAASASDAGMTGSTLDINGDNSADVITVTFDAGGVPDFRVADADGISDNDGAGECTDEGNFISCPVSLVDEIAMDLFDGDDTTSFGNNFPEFGDPGEGVDVSGGEDDDTINGSNLDDFLSGLAGDDAIASEDGADILRATTGEDDLDGGAGGDVIEVRDPAGAPDMSGGSGDDLVTYELMAPAASVVVDLDDVADDGPAPLNDNVRVDIEEVIGSDLSDQLTGTAGTQRLQGRDGDDLLDGGTGGDALVGGADSDTVSYASRSNPVTVLLTTVTATAGEAGEGDSVQTTENAIGGSGADTLTGDASPNTLDGAAGADTIDGALGNDDLLGGTQIDTVTYASRGIPVTVSLFTETGGVAGETDDVTGFENVTGGTVGDILQGSDLPNTIDGRGGDDTLIGLGGGDILDGGTQADNMVGGAGPDTVTYASRVSPVNVNLSVVNGDGEAGENDNVAADIETVIGGSSSDNLTGTSGTQTLEGGNGSDTLNGGPGVTSDTLLGGAARDTASYAGRAEAVVATAGSAAGQGAAGENDTFGSIENLTGGDESDTLTGDGIFNVLSGGPHTDFLDGGPGIIADDLVGGDGSDFALYTGRTNPVNVDLSSPSGDGEAGENDSVQTENVRGGSGDDTLAGDDANNFLLGELGNDTLDGRVGADQLLAGGGIDTVTYASRVNAVDVDLGSPGSDGEAGEFDFLSGLENIIGGQGNDELSGNLSPNVFRGGPGNDTLDGGLGADILDGEGGTDVAAYNGRSGAVTVDLGTPGGDGEPGENDSALTESVTGGSAPDVLTGGAGPNSIIGGAGGDTIDGKTGADTISSGAGADQIAARDSTVDAIACGTEADTVEADAADGVNADCETVNLPAVVIPPVTPPGGGADKKIELTAAALPKQKLATLALEAGCKSEQCAVAITGKIVIKGGATPKKGLSLKLAPASGLVPANQLTSFKLGLKGKRNLARAKGLLKTGAKGNAQIDVSATDAAGNTAAQKLGVKVK